MKTNALKIMAMALAAFAGLSTALSAQAIQRSGTLGVKSFAVDVYSFACPIGTVRALMKVTDTNKIINTAATVYATFGEKGIPAPTVYDTESSSTSSPWAINASDGPGNYALVIRKSAPNPEDYNVEAQCLNRQSRSIGPATMILHINQ